MVVLGMNSDSRVRSIATTVASVDDVSFPLSRTLQFREANLEVARLVNGPTDFDGVIVGSAIVKQIAAHGSDSAIVEKVTAFGSTLTAALRS